MVDGSPKSWCAGALRGGFACTDSPASPNSPCTACLQLVNQRCLRAPHDVQGDGLIGVAAKASDGTRRWRSRGQQRDSDDDHRDEDSNLDLGHDPYRPAPLYFRLRRVGVRLSRLAFAATFLRYCSTILSPEASVIRLVPALAAAIIFSLTMRWASRWAAFPPRINFAIRSPTTRLLSRASIIQFHML